MGVVYQAEDLDLKRTVALKFISDAAMGNQEVRARLVREAQAAASLDHPNICYVHGIHEERGRLFIAMAHIDGSTLAEKIKDRPLEFERALDIAIQVLSGLQEAHEGGILHRDIKPGNILLTKKGAAKITDFGLAQLADRSRLTTRGKVMGTPAYMSPEQIQGKEVDQRTDLWSVGVLLFEMLTGRLPFDADYEMAVAYGIVNETPEPVTALRTGLPTDIDRIIFKALEKEPQDRYQHADEMRVDLSTLQKRSAGQSVNWTATQKRPLFRAASPFALLAVGSALVAAVIGWSLYVRPPRSEIKSDGLLQRLTADAGLSFQPTIARNGSLICYASDRAGAGNLDLWVRQLAGRQEIRLTRDPADDYEPALSPDGTTIAFRSERDPPGIYVQPALGGAARLLATGGHLPQFSPDGNQIAYRDGDRRLGSGIFIASLDGSPPRRLTVEFEKETPVYWSNPIWSPDGNSLLFATGNANQTDQWWTVPAIGGPASSTNAAELFSAHGLVVSLPQAWLDDGSVVFSARAPNRANRNLWKIKINQSDPRAAGQPERLTFGTGDETYAVFGSGALAFSSLNEAYKVWSIKADVESGRVLADPEPLTTGLSADGSAWISFDGAALVYVSNPQGKGQFGDPMNDVHFKNLMTGETAVLAGSEASENSPLISNDREDVLYVTLHSGKQNTNIVPVSGGLPQTLCEDCGVVSGWSNDKAKILFNIGRPSRVTVLDRPSQAPVPVLEHPELDLYSALFSPDDGWISFHARRPNQKRRIYLARHHNNPISESEWIPIAVDEFNNAEPRWSPEGNLLYFLSDRDGFLCIWAQRLTKDSKAPAGPPQEVYHFHQARLSPLNVSNSGYVRMSIGQGRIILTLGEITGNVWLLKEG